MFTSTDVALIPTIIMITRMTKSGGKPLTLFSPSSHKENTNGTSKCRDIGTYAVDNKKNWSHNLFGNAILNNTKESYFGV